MPQFCPTATIMRPTTMEAQFLGGKTSVSKSTVQTELHKGEVSGYFVHNWRRLQLLGLAKWSNSCTACTPH